MAVETGDIPVVILAGGRGARFDHESQVLPKPMISVAGKPMIQHIIDSLASQGFREFIVATGYLREEFGSHFCKEAPSEHSWKHGTFYSLYTFANGVTVRCVDTGLESHTGERLWRLREYIGRRRFVLTYGDGLSDVDMQKVLARHTEDLFVQGGHPGMQRPLVTLTAVNPPGRFGKLEFNGALCNHVRSFYEKGHDEWINGGFMVVEPQFIDECISRPDASRQLEAEALPMAADCWRLKAYRHDGYWRCMDTRRDLEQIEEDVRLNGGNLPWLR